MGADARFRAAKEARERNQFDGQLAQAIKDQDDRALPSDKFGLTVRPGTLIMHFTNEPTPPICTVTDVATVLDPRAPAGMLKMQLVYEVLVPAGMANPHLLVVGEAPFAAPKPAPEVEVSRPEEPVPVGGGLTDVQ